jgi:hypothetical protein
VHGVAEQFPACRLALLAQLVAGHGGFLLAEVVSG